MDICDNSSPLSLPSHNREDRQGLSEKVVQRKNAEERLHWSEKHFRALIENSADAIGLMDAQGYFLYASPSTVRVLGYEPEELVGINGFDVLVHPNDVELTRCTFAALLRQPGKSQITEFRVRHKDGTWRWIEGSGLNLLEEPDVTAIVVNYRDITVRKQLEYEVAKAKEQLEIILRNVADGIVVVDAKDRFVYVNDVVAHWFGYSSPAAMLASRQEVSVHWHDKYPTWDEWGQPLPASERPAVRALRGESAKALVKYGSPTGRVYWILVRAQPIFDEQGKVQFVVCVYTDITEQKEFEQRKDHFISMASHELKTPLTILSAFTQLLRERFEAEDRQDVMLHLSKVDDQINKLTRLVADLLDISKIQAGKLDLAQEAVSIDELVREVVENLQPTTTHRLIIEGVAGQTTIGDKDRLGQVLINLLTNAIKYSPQAKAVFVKVAQKHNMLLVSIQDFGVGIAQSHQERLFERFYRVYSEKDSTYPGLGIGLYIAYEIIQRHGGKMWVESVEGKGSTFSFSLPIR